MFRLQLIAIAGLYLSAATSLQAQLTPEITSWNIQQNGQTGYNGLPANVQSVHYTSTDVYIEVSCIPRYDIGPWAGNPNTPANQNFTFKMTRTPVKNTGTPVQTPLGHVGVWSNGVSIFNARDAMSYNNQNVWHQDALPNEGMGFDACLGHPAPNGEYHHHVNPTCIYDDQATTVHSPIIGYAFDGFPIYGAYGYADTNGTGGIARMRTGYRLRNITTRTTLPDGSTASSAGPAVSTQYPLGKYLEDYEYVPGLGDLDEHNGRYCVTPEYPNGIYAYFVTIDSNQFPLYPYTIGPTYYGTVPAGNTGPQSGHNTIPSNATEYTPVATGMNNNETESADWIAYPNPFSNQISLQANNNGLPYTLSVYDLQGKLVFYVKSTENIYTLQTAAWSPGVYLVEATLNEQSYRYKMTKF